MQHMFVEYYNVILEWIDLWSEETLLVILCGKKRNGKFEKRAVFGDQTVTFNLRSSASSSPCHFPLFFLFTSLPLPSPPPLSLSTISCFYPREEKKNVKQTFNGMVITYNKSHLHDYKNLSTIYLPSLYTKQPAIYYSLAKTMYNSPWIINWSNVLL